MESNHVTLSEKTLEPSPKKEELPVYAIANENGFENTFELSCKKCNLETLFSFAYLYRATKEASYECTLCGHEEILSKPEKTRLVVGEVIAILVGHDRVENVKKIRQHGVKEIQNYLGTYVGVAPSEDCDTMKGECQVTFRRDEVGLFHIELQRATGILLKKENFVVDRFEFLTNGLVTGIRAVIEQPKTNSRNYLSFFLPPDPALKQEVKDPLATLEVEEFGLLFVNSLDSVGPWMFCKKGEPIESILPADSVKELPRLKYRGKNLADWEVLQTFKKEEIKVKKVLDDPKEERFKSRKEQFCSACATIMPHSFSMSFVDDPSTFVGKYTCNKCGAETIVRKPQLVDSGF